MCEDCENREETYGTPETLRDYGFVEQYPQRWILETVRHFHDALTLSYDIVEEIKTPYQFISVMYKPTTKDTCFDLDDTV